MKQVRPSHRARAPLASGLANGVLWAAMAALGVASLIAQQAPAQSPRAVDPPPVVFRAEANFIEIDAFVTDAAGNSVPGLTVADFELFEEGRPQEVLSFTAVDLPIERGERPLFSPRPIEPDVRSNAGGEGRIYLILLDDVHVHPSRIPRVRAALHQFIERNFGTNDLAAVTRVRGGSQDAQEFTNNPRLLLRAIDRFTGNVPREAPRATVAVEGSLSAAEIEVAHEARTVSSRVRELSEFLAAVRGRRKAMLFVSEGSPFDVNAVMGQSGSVASMVLEDTQKAIAAATRGNVTIYTIDPRGLVPMDANDLAGEALPTGMGMRLAQDGLRQLATETGGFASVNMNDLEGTFTRIVRENSAYYVLGYSPSNDRRDGKYRSVQVRVKRPGLQVRSRSGYTAASGRPSPTPAPSAGITSVAVANALASPLPTSGVPLTVFAAPYRGNSVRRRWPSRSKWMRRGSTSSRRTASSPTSGGRAHGHGRERKDALPDASQRGPCAETGDVRANEDRWNQGALAHGFAAGAIPAAGGRR